MLGTARHPLQRERTLLDAWQREFERPTTPTMTRPSAGPRFHRPVESINPRIDKTWDNDWSNGRVKTKQPSQNEELLLPYGTVDIWRPEQTMTREQEIAWMVSTSGYGEDGHITHPGFPCAHDQDVPTTRAQFVANAIKVEASSQGLDPDDEYVSDPAADIFGSPQDPTVYVRPLPQVLRQIEDERASVRHGTVVKWTLRPDFQTGEPKVIYWAGWETPPQRDATGNDIRGTGKPRRLNLNDARTKSVHERIVNTLLESGVTLDTAQAMRLRSQFYGPGWALSLMDPRTLKRTLNRERAKHVLLPVTKGATFATNAIPQCSKFDEHHEEARRNGLSEPLCRSCDAQKQAKYEELLDARAWGDTAYGEWTIDLETEKPRFDLFEEHAAYLAAYELNFSSPTSDDFWIEPVI